MLLSVFFFRNSLQFKKVSLPLQPQTRNNGAIAQLVEQRTENPCVPGSIPGGTTLRKSKSLQTPDFQTKSGVFLFPQNAKKTAIYSPFRWSKRWSRKEDAKSRLSGNFWLLSFKISYLCLPLFYETRTTPSCHPSGCAYRQL